MALILDGTNGLSDVDGSASTPAIRGTDTNTGIFFPAADTIGFAEGGVEVMRLDSSGNLGLGVTPNTWDAGYKAFQTSGYGVFSGTSGGWIAANTYVQGSAAKFMGNGYAPSYLANTSDGKHYWYTTTNNSSGAGTTATLTQAMTLDASGNLAVGTTSADTTTLRLTPTNSDAVQRTLHIGYNGSMSSGTNGSYISFGNSTPSTNQLARIASYYEGGTYSGSLRFYTNANTDGANPTERMRIDSSGNVAIGLTPTSTSTNGKVIIFNSQIDGAQTIANSGLLFANSGGFASGAIYPIGSSGFAGSLVFTTASAKGGPDYVTTERMRIDSSGNLLVGTTDSSLTSGMGVKFIANATHPFMGYVSNTSSAANTCYHLYSVTAGVMRFYVATNGQISATVTSIAGISDASLKENVKDLETGLTEVMALKPRRFDWKNGDGTNVAGFVAQEVEQVLPDLVADYIYNKDKNGNDIIKKSLKMGDILPTLVKAVQEQQAIITDLKARIETLESK